MLIAAEGPDLSGKTTLIESLAERVEDPKILNAPRDLKTRGEALRHYIFDFDSYRPGAGENILLDGCYLFEATNLEQTSADGFGLLGKGGWRWTEMFFASRGLVIATLTADNTTLAARASDSEEDYVLDSLFHASSRYEYARRESINVFGIHDGSLGESNEERYDYFVNSVLGDGQYWEDQAANTLQGKFEGYIGTLKPTTLLVEYEREKGYKSFPSLPHEGSDTEYLLASLPDQFWRGCGMINAASYSSDDIQDLWELLGQPNVVSIGKSAGDHLSEAFGHVSYIVHPSSLASRNLGVQRAYGKAIRDLGLGNQGSDLGTTTEEINA